MNKSLIGSAQSVRSSRSRLIVKWKTQTASFRNWCFMQIFIQWRQSIQCDNDVMYEWQGEGERERKGDSWCDLHKRCIPCKWPDLLNCRFINKHARLKEVFPTRNAADPPIGNSKWPISDYFRSHPAAVKQQKTKRIFETVLFRINCPAFNVSQCTQSMMCNCQSDRFQNFHFWELFEMNLNLRQLVDSKSIWIHVRKRE